MKRNLILLLLLVTSVTFAQVKFEGTVKDSIGTPLELANVVAINQTTKIMDAYGITNADGKYKLSLEKNTTYNIQISYIGFKTEQRVIAVKEDNIQLDYILQTDTSLDEVEIVYEMPVTVKGDTIIYNADSFKNGTERKLEDILKKLPGVEVNADGEIEVEGKKVTKVMVEGKDFFDGDSKLATKNIPSNAVDKVQVLKNYSSVGQLSGVTNNQDNIAINIKLKEGKGAFWFGTVTAGGGDSENNSLYLLQPKLFFYSPEYSINLIGDLNNIGEVAFSRRDYFNFTGGFKMPSQSSGTNLNLGNNNLGFLALQNNKAKDINTKFGAANFSMSPNKALDLSGFAIFSNSRVQLQENNFVQYTDEDFNIPNESTASATKQSSDLGMLKLSAKYKPNANNQLDYDILGRVSKETQNQNFLSSEIGNINQVENTKPYSINQNINYYYTANENNIFAFSGQHLLQDEDPFYNAFLEDKTNYNDTANGLGLDNMQVGYDIAQEKRVKSNQLDVKLDYWNVLNTKSNINFTLGTIYSQQDFNSNLFQFLDDGSAFNPTPTLNDGRDENDTKYTFNDVYLGAHYRFITGKFTFTPGLSAHAYSSENAQFGADYKNTFTRVLPDFNMRIQLKKSEQLVLNYSMQTEFTDVTDLARGVVLNNYNALSIGNPELESALAHAVNLTYFSFNMFNYTNVFANVGYTKNIDRIRSASNFAPGSVISVSSPFNSDFADESITITGRFQRSFGKLKATVSGNFNYAKFNQFINSKVSTNENYTQTYSVGFSSNYRTAPNFDIGYRLTLQDNDQGATRSKFYTHAPSIDFDALILKRFTFRTDYTFNDFRNQEESINNYEFWNASLSYRKTKDSKFEYEVKATNILDTKSQNNTSTSAFSVSTTEYFIQPRFVTFRVIYSL
ncbi:TonB-dependent receptor [Bizionia gelidisalsuginis]|uniref:TonB-dependent receptor n=1 Tax=Bizionia gelidisalsuginis TaxID=291188 RepID=A0ABY3MAA1_9FLAO|nr:carboxypeptidase-like regulatory domain-containing protein [Bizionia gelidisalsuginis]TYC12689.1 TonB-dependent receptor [Bizionia gelidisalsuginis]